MIQATQINPAQAFRNLQEQIQQKSLQQGSLGKLNQTELHQLTLHQSWLQQSVSQNLLKELEKRKNQLVKDICECSGNPAMIAYLQPKAIQLNEVINLLTLLSNSEYYVSTIK